MDTDGGGVGGGLAPSVDGTRTREGRNHRRPVKDQGYSGSWPFSVSTERLLLLDIPRRRIDPGDRSGNGDGDGVCNRVCNGE